jgi:carbonic anhydrase
VIGSIEFAASQFGSRLVVVMGHTRCGAIAATVKAIETGLGPESKNLHSITDRIAAGHGHRDSDSRTQLFAPRPLPSSRPPPSVWRTFTR